MLRATRRALIVLGLLGLFVRALVPVGLMPAPESAGGPLVFCHGDATGAFLRALAARGAAQQVGPGESASHAGHDAGHDAGHHATYVELAASTEPTPLGNDDVKTDHFAWEHCSFGTAFAQAALAPTFELPLLALEHAHALPAPPAHSTTVTAHRYWARGPPLRTT
jgi:hypothetical protein